MTTKRPSKSSAKVRAQGTSQPPVARTHDEAPLDILDIHPHFQEMNEMLKLVLSEFEAIYKDTFEPYGYSKDGALHAFILVMNHQDNSLRAGEEARARRLVRTPFPPHDTLA